VDPADRERYRREVLSLADDLAGPDADRAVWEVYARTEKLIAVLKFSLDYETPGVFTKLPDAGDPAKLLNDARDLLSRASGEMGRGELVESIATLRKARNCLRSRLTEAKRSATRGSRVGKSKREGAATQ
jgi:hypothetical protein